MLWCRSTLTSLICQTQQRLWKTIWLLQLFPKQIWAQCNAEFHRGKRLTLQGGAEVTLRSVRPLTPACLTKGGKNTKPLCNSIFPHLLMDTKRDTKLKDTPPTHRCTVICVATTLFCGFRSAFMWCLTVSKHAFHLNLISFLLACGHFFTHIILQQRCACTWNQFIFKIQSPRNSPVQNIPQSYEPYQPFPKKSNIIII